MHYLKLNSRMKKLQKIHKQILKKFSKMDRPDYIFYYHDLIFFKDVQNFKKIYGRIY